MPPFVYKPVGGFKIIYDYANMLVNDGYDVNIVYGDKTKYDRIDLSFLLFLKLYVKHWLFRMRFMKRSARIWFPLDERVHEYNVYSLARKYVPNTDIYVCTGVDTAPWLYEYKIENERKFYFIQGYEAWGRPEEEVRKTYHYGMRNIVISEWLRRIIEDEEGMTCSIVPNGFNPLEYYLTVPVEQKKATEISMLYHSDKRKGCETSFAALEIVKSQYPEIHVNVFGTPERPDFLPEWYTYYQNPTHDEHLRINNESAIYVAASTTEGWGLTIGEAMMCGQAVCCTRTYGFMEMAVDGENALISPIGDAESLARNIIRLIEDRELRLRIAADGLRSIKSFSRQNSYRKLKEVLELS